MENKLSWNKRQWCILCALCSVLFIGSVRKSLENRFFAREARLKGLAEFEQGLVIGIHELVLFIVSPFLGKYIRAMGANNMLSAGIFITSVTSICVGFLDMINSHDLYIGLASVMRIVEALGYSAVYTSSFAIIAIVFRNSIACTVAIFQVFLCLGYFLGASLSGYILFEFQGVKGPFVTLGFVLLLQALVIFSLPPIIDNETSRVGNQGPVKIMEVLALAPVSVNLFATVGAACTLGFITPLALHLYQFEIRLSTISNVFMVLPVTNLLSAPLVGYLCDTSVSPKGFVIIGSGLIICGFSLIGPAFSFPVDTTLWLVCLGVALHGIGYSSIIIASFTDAIHSAIACGLPNEMGLYGVVSGLTLAAFAIGNSVGPILAVYLYELVGFSPSVLFVIIVHAIVVGTVSYNACVDRPREDIHAASNYHPLKELDGEKANLTSQGGDNRYGT